MKAVIYRIRDWNRLFENNRTRELKKLDWVPVPNKHDGDGFTDLLSRQNGIALYGAWHLILQLASKCEPRGTLIRHNPAPRCGDLNLPHDAVSISRITRGPELLIKEALKACLEIGWLECEVLEISDLQNSPEISRHNPAPACGKVTIEGKGREGNRMEQNTHTPPNPSTSSAAQPSTTPAKVCVGVEGENPPTPTPVLKQAFAVDTRVTFLTDWIQRFFNRPPGRLISDCEELHLIAEVARRPDLTAEVRLIEGLRAKLQDRSKFPRSACRLLSAWQSKVDEARTYQAPRSERTLEDKQHDALIRNLEKVCKTVFPPPAGSANGQ